MRPRPFWQHPDSLAADPDEGLRRAIQHGRQEDFPTDAYGDFIELAEGFNRETDEELIGRRMAANIARLHISDEDLTAREAEAVSRYLWGHRVPNILKLWELRAYPNVYWLLLRRPQPWSVIAGLMVPTATGRPVPRSNAIAYVRSAALKLETKPSGLRELMEFALLRRMRPEVCMRIMKSRRSQVVQRLGVC